MSSQHQSGRTAKGFALILGAARAAGLKDRPSDGKALVKKAERDELVILAMNDPVMAAAIHGARKTPRKFLTLAKNPGPTTDGFAVKIALSRGEWRGIFQDSSVRACRRAVHRANQQLAALGCEFEDGRHHYLRAKRNRRLDVHGCRQDEGQLFRACHPQVGASG
jgi:hypothetical protein